MYKAFPYEKTSVRTKLYKCFYVFISYRERISFISDAAPRRLTSKCACGRVLFKSQLLTLGYFCFGYRPVGSYIFFGNRSHMNEVRFSNIFIEKRTSCFLKALQLQGFFYLRSFNALVKKRKCWRIIFSRGRNLSTAFSKNTHLQMLVASYISAFGAVWFHYKM